MFQTSPVLTWPLQSSVMVSCEAICLPLARCTRGVVTDASCYKGNNYSDRPFSQKYPAPLAHPWLRHYILSIYIILKYLRIDLYVEIYVTVYGALQNVRYKWAAGSSTYVPLTVDKTTCVWNNHAMAGGSVHFRAVCGFRYAPSLGCNVAHPV